jgi:hypothetical protein
MLVMVGVPLDASVPCAVSFSRRPVSKRRFLGA